MCRANFQKAISNCRERERCLICFILLFPISLLKVWGVSLNMYFQNKPSISGPKAPKKEWFEQPLGQAILFGKITPKRFFVFFIHKKIYFI